MTFKAMLATTENTKICRGPCGKSLPATTEHFYSRGGGRPGLASEFILEIYEEQGGRCAWLGVELRIEFGGDYHHPSQVSLDRIDNTKGYTQNNVMLVSQAANLARCDTPAEVFADFIRSAKKEIKL